MKHKVILLNGSGFTSSTLLIPEALIPFFRKKVTEFGSLVVLFHYIVNKKHPLYKLGPLPRSGKTSYQNSGQDLKRVDFFPYNQDWEKFRLLALQQRISMTYLFVLLLRGWDKFEISSKVVPKLPEKIRLIQSLKITTIFTYLELERINE